MTGPVQTPQGFSNQGAYGGCICNNELYVTAPALFNRDVTSGAAARGMIAKYDRATDTFIDAGMLTADKNTLWTAAIGRLLFPTAIGDSIYFYAGSTYRKFNTVTKVLSSIGTSSYIPNGILAWNGKLIVYGDIYAGGSLPANYLNAYDAVAGTWSGMGIFDSDVFQASTDGTNLYAVGAFSTINGNPAKSVAKYDGVNWSEVGGGCYYSGYGSMAWVCGRWVDGCIFIMGYVDRAGSGGNAISFTVNPNSSYNNLIEYNIATDTWRLISNSIECRSAITQDINRAPPFGWDAYTQILNWHADGKFIAQYSNIFDDGESSGLFSVTPGGSSLPMYPPGKMIFPYLNVGSTHFRPETIAGIIDLPKIIPEDPQQIFIVGPYFAAGGGLYQLGGDYIDGSLQPPAIGFGPWPEGLQGLSVGATRFPIGNSETYLYSMAARRFGLIGGHRLIAIDGKTSYKRFQGTGANFVNIPLKRFFEINPTASSWPIATELTDYCKATDPRLWMHNYRIGDLGESFTFNLGWMQDDEEGLLLMHRKYLAWDPLTGGAGSNIPYPCVRLSDLALMSWPYRAGKTDANWSLVRAFDIFKYNGGWYSMGAAGGSATQGPIMKYDSGSDSWVDVPGWSSVSSGDKTKINAIGPFVCLDDGRFICINGNVLYRYDISGGTYSILRDCKMLDKLNAVNAYGWVRYGDYLVIGALLKDMTLSNPGAPGAYRIKVDGSEALTAIAVQNGTMYGGLPRNGAYNGYGFIQLFEDRMIWVPGGANPMYMAMYQQMIGPTKTIRSQGVININPDWTIDETYSAVPPYVGSGGEYGAICPPFNRPAIGGCFVYVP